MKMNKPLKLGIFLLIGILLMTSVVMAYYRSQTNYVQYGPYDRSGLFGTYTQDRCELGQDFILQVSPLGCEPAMVRSDLLEEQNVPVFCPISATQMNPLIDVDAINSMSIKGKYPKEVATVGFHPAEGALNPYQNELTQPVILENIGYAVIVLRKQENESAMPDYVEGNLTARIRYDIHSAFGVGQSSFYLPVLDESDWEEKYKQYSFWDGRGYLRAEGVYDDGATISIYSDQYRSGILGHGDEKMLYQAPINLKEGETSDELYIPGFDFCLATMRIRLDELEDPNVRARFRVNGNPVEVKENERFLENNCWVTTEPKKSGVNSEVTFKCKEDRKGFHKGKINLKITPNIVLNIDDNVVNKSVGDYLYTFDAILAKNDRKVFLGYAGTIADTGQEENLYAYLIAVPSEDKPGENPKLTSEEIEVAETIAKKMVVEITDDSSIGQRVGEIYDHYVGAQSKKWAWLKGDSFRELRYGGTNLFPKFGKDVELLGFAGAYDKKLPEDTEEEFNNAVKDYEEIVSSFPDEMDLDEKLTLGEKSLYDLIDLANGLAQKRTMLEYCDEFRQKYSTSNQSLEMCTNELKLSSSTSSNTEVLIDEHVYKISFEGVYEPNEYEYSAEIKVNHPGGNVTRHTLTRNDPVYLNFEEGEYIMLEDLEENSAQLRLNIKRSSSLGNLFEEKTETILLNVPKSFSSDYSLTLTEVNLKKVAKVSLIPNVNYAQTNASFNFRVNIDKRNIQLSPEKTKDKIEKLDENIEKWNRISEGLGKVVKTMKVACLGTSAALTVKNYLQNVGGKGIARESVMNGDYGWYDRCKDMVSDKKYATSEQCLIKESDNIDADVDTYYKYLSQQQTDIKKIQEKHKIDGELFSSDRVDTEAFVNEYSEKVRTNLNSLGDTFEDPQGTSESINIQNIKDVFSTTGFEENKYSVEQLRDVDLYTKLLSSTASENIKETAERNLYSTLLDVQVNSEDESTKFALINKLKEKGLVGVGGGIYNALEDSITGVYSGGSTGSDGFGDIGVDAPVELVVFGHEGYLLELKAYTSTDYAIENIYNENGNKITDNETIEKIKTRIDGFKKYDETSYKNVYKTPLVHYYETEPYKGYPATVPFDLNEGWYVAVKQTLPVFGGIASYDESGRVASFYVCNIGRNGKEEDTRGDDVCEMINTFTGQPYNQFPGISDKGKASALIRAASNAVEDAQREYRSGVRSVTISTTFGKYDIKVGNPAVDVPGIKCQDFMSPKDCNVLFNVCDPVICPSSRCDFGGNYPVQDVIQSGIIGSVALCLPNAKEGIRVPVCLTGIQAGLDGLLSISNSYKDCLQENLDTGQTIGICDEIHSIYMCEYFYRQGLPIAKLGIPKLTELIVSGGKGSRGGGEYLGVSDAWQRAENSVNYFAQYYAQNSFEAFKARSVEEAGQEIVCDKFISLSYPGGGGLLDAITTPDSPIQFYGRFEEIPFTTVTNPPQSQYKVYYHIYSGKDRGAYYRVYLKGDPGSSFYQDNMFRIDVATGYVGKGDYASNTEDFTAPSGYKELCIMVNGQEECGFKEVTTNFAVNYVGDSFVAQQVKQTDIKTESACVSGTASLYSLLNPNLQAGAEDLISPSLYNEGVIRICATRNPGEGTDSNAGMQGSRWVEVGYCGDNNLKCWLDTQSVKKSIDFNNIEEEALNVTTQNYQEILIGEGGYLTSGAFNSTITNIKNTESYIEKINLINEVLAKAFYNNQKAYLLYLRGSAYKALALGLFGESSGEDLGEECEINGKEECDGTKVMRCVDNRLTLFTDCALTGRLCTTGGTNKAECVARQPLPTLCETTWEEECDGTKIMKCSSSGAWILFIDCATTKELCTIKNGLGECISYEQASEILGIELWTLGSATEYVKTLTGTYSDNKGFIDKLYQQEIITFKEYNTIRGQNYYFGIKSAEKEMDYVQKVLQKKLDKEVDENVKEAEEQIKEEEETEEKVESFLGNSDSWKSWEDVKDSFRTDLFDNTEKGVILNAKSCEECGKGTWNRCEKEECIAIGFKLRDSLKLEKICTFTGLWGCDEVSLVETEEEEIIDVDELGDIPSGETCDIIEPDPEVSSISEANLRVLEEADKIAGEGDLPPGVATCWDAVHYTYKRADVRFSCVYSEFHEFHEKVSVAEYRANYQDPFFTGTAAGHGSPCTVTRDPFDLQEGDLVQVYNKNSMNGEHNFIFHSWVNEGEKMAKVYDSGGRGGPLRFREYDLSTRPVTTLWKPV